VIPAIGLGTPFAMGLARCPGDAADAADDDKAAMKKPRPDRGKQVP
jgi:hypothetical protein